MYHFQGVKETHIRQNLQEQYAINLPLQKIREIISTVDSWKNDPLGKAQYYQIGITRKEWIAKNIPIDLVNVGNQWVKSQTDIPMRMPTTLVFKEKKKKKTIDDVIKIITAVDCEYCSATKEDGSYQDMLQRVSQKYNQYYYIIEVETRMNPTLLYKNPETREIANYYRIEMGEIPAIFDIYFPCFYIQGNSWGVYAQFRQGIYIKVLDKIIEYIHTRKLRSVPFAYLPPRFHTTVYMSKSGSGMKKGVRSLLMERGAS